MAYSFIAHVTPLHGVSPLTVEVSMTESGGTAAKFEIDWDDGTVEDVVGTGPHRHQYTEPGTADISVRAFFAAIWGTANAHFAAYSPEVTTITGTDATTYPLPDGAAAATVTFVVKDQAGAPMAGIVVLIETDTLTSRPGGSSTNSTQMQTDANGVASVNVTNTVAERVTVTASVGEVSGTATAIFRHAVGSVTVMALTTGPVPADDVTPFQLIFRTLDHDGQPLTGQRLDITTGSSTSRPGYTPGYTDTNAEFLVYIFNTVPETVLATATAIGGATVSANTYFS